MTTKITEIMRYSVLPFRRMRGDEIHDARIAMSPVYPYDLVFDLAPGRYRAAVEAAAASLQLPLQVEGETIVRVTVFAPDQAYRFGQKTGELLNGEPIPMPHPKQPKP